MTTATDASPAQAAAMAAGTWDCACCGMYSPDHLKPAIAPDGTTYAKLCAACHPLVETALRERSTNREGQTRAQLVEALVTRAES